MYFVQRHPLEGLLPAHPPAPKADHLSILPDPVLLSVLVKPGDEAVIADISTGVSRRFCGPSEWLLLCDDASREPLADRLSAAGVRWLDQTHGYVVVQLCGPHARAILAKGLAVDLHPASFPVGQSANALCGQVQVNIARVSDDGFELVVRRSYASFFFQDIMQAGREFSLTAGFAAAAPLTGAAI
ncbi:sarcosine oxidase subunit gamma [Agrobacterium vitis]|nr:sarcosine oxidase subunit gamma [Agrobacterium vitis]MBE1436972.1 sarcosine oxidase subunit gamma [Agrobacterium vitis]